MPVLIDGTAVIIRNDALERCLDGGASEFTSIAPNSMSYSDGQLSQSSFMSSRDAELFRDKLMLMGLEVDDDEPEIVLVDTHRRTIEPECGWLQLMEYKGSLIACLAGNESDVVIAPETWDPESGSKLQHMSAEEVEERLEYVRREERIDVYRDKETGQLYYSARLHETSEELFRQATEIVWSHARQPGQPPPPMEVQERIREAIGTLQQLANRHDDAWRIWFMLGKAWHAVDQSDRAIRAFHRAMELFDGQETDILKELSGLLLEDGQTKKACEIGEKAVALNPDDEELLGNLAIAYVLDGRLQSARKTLDHALSISSSDTTNRLLENRLRELEAGRLPIPQNLAEFEMCFGGHVHSSPPRPLGWLRRIKRKFVRKDS